MMVPESTYFGLHPLRGLPIKKSLSLVSQGSDLRLPHNLLSIETIDTCGGFETHLVTGELAGSPFLNYACSPSLV